MSPRIKIDILVASGCSSRQQTEKLVADLLAEIEIDADIETKVIENADQAVTAAFLGSPSVRVNGLDVETEARNRRDYGMG
ncbi:DF family (seleno)protein [Desulfomarina sp.]